MATERLHALLVEDDDAYATMLQTDLSLAASVNLTIDRASCLSDAVSRLSEATFDAVLLDLGLPDSSGLETFSRMRHAAGHRAIVVLTARDDDALAIAAVQAGAQDYLVKSSTDAQLLDRALRYACERAQFQRTLVENEERLRQSQRMEAVGRLAGGVAHDFNNVLTAIFGYTDLLLEQFANDDPRQGDVREIRRAAERAATLTRQLLAFSRKQVLQPRVLDLTEVVAAMEPLLRRLIGAGVTLSVRGASQALVRADPGQIEQVLMNLCDNARDATPEGGRVDITTDTAVLHAADVRQIAGLAPGPYVRLTVRDTGDGIPENIRPHIFEPFFTTKDQDKGTGLGLATVYGIVKQSGGGISVESRAGEGTAFSIYLPEWKEEH